MPRGKPFSVKNPRFFPTYKSSNPEIKEQLIEKMYILGQHMRLGGERNVRVEVRPYQVLNDVVESIQIVPIRDSIDAITGLGNKGSDGVERDFTMISNRFDPLYFLMIGEHNKPITKYLIYQNPRTKK